MRTFSQYSFLLAVKQPVGAKAVWFVDRIGVLAFAVAAVCAVVARAAGDGSLHPLGARPCGALCARTRSCGALRASARTCGALCACSRSSRSIRAQ